VAAGGAQREPADHPHIVPVFEADVHEQQPYLVFEYVAGPTLAEQLRARGAMPAREAVEMMLGVLDALQAAHAAAWCTAT
jgi:serine/threonine protein kinase